MGKRRAKVRYPLHSAVERGDLAEVKRLLGFQHIDINFCKPPLGQTALYVAVVSGNREMVRLLMENGADGSITDRLGKTPLDIASTLGLGGYREPGEENFYPGIIALLNGSESVSEKSYRNHSHSKKTDPDIEVLSKNLEVLHLYHSNANTGNSIKKKNNIVKESKVENCRLM